MKKCNRCLEPKELLAFPKHGISGNVCKACGAARARQQRLENGDERRAIERARYAQIVAHKDRPCQDCRQVFPLCCMDFDHVRGKKVFNLSQCTTRSWGVILEEIAKCDIVCANCHRIRTYSRKQWSAENAPLKHRIPKLGAKRSVEARNRMSETQKRLWADPIHRKMMLDARVSQSA